jgi:hypothetical protein
VVTRAWPGGHDLPTDAHWSALISHLARHKRGPPLSASTISSFEKRVGFVLPRALRNLYLSLGNGFTPHFLPLVTGREDEAFLERLSDPAEAFAAAAAAFASVLGWHEAHTTASRDADDVWVRDLLLVADYGCAVYFAIDLSDPNLRVIEYEHFEPSEHPELDAQRSGVALAYTDDRVPRPLRLRFTLASPSLYDWLSAWVAHGDGGL